MNLATFITSHWELITGITGWIAGVTGWAFGIAGFLRARKESRFHSLEGAIRLLVEAAQALNDANECRTKCDSILRSYPCLN